MIFAGTMKVGELTGFLSYVLQILNSLMMISNVFLMLTRSIASGERILEVLDEEVDIRDLPQAEASVSCGDIVFDHVYFKYKAEAEEFVLRDITLHLSLIHIFPNAVSLRYGINQRTILLYIITEDFMKQDILNLRILSAI